MGLSGWSSREEVVHGQGSKSIKTVLMDTQNWVKVYTEGQGSISQGLALCHTGGSLNPTQFYPMHINILSKWVGAGQCSTTNPNGSKFLERIFPFNKKIKLKNIAKENNLDSWYFFQHLRIDSNDVAVILTYFSKLKIR